MEAKLQKLKVTELKELLANHHLVQTGKKDDLVKRLLDNNVTLEDDSTEELVDPDAVNDTPQSDAPPAAAQTSAASSSLPPAAEPPTNEASEPSPEDLTPEQKAMKARAERFGIPFNPNAKPKSSNSRNGVKESTAAKPKSTPAATTSAASITAPQKKEKAGAIDSASLGISEDVLAKRAAKFGLPEKKEQPKASAPVTPTSTSVSTPKLQPKAESKKAEVTPEMAEKLAVEEEKKRKRAEKFGFSKPSSETNGSEPDAKKVKV
ncbi:uncharacterized protein IL334_007258 [Kwoniella shivajii]|uniref:SAP domain-containing protein n=1 Tax=Kwoniella shivajii TaxID=564305 RepID=A0ABZ1D8N7_9TREE|nr:hypothetical protein IL334_007258 [Kwoniella shivajii]